MVHCTVLFYNYVHIPSGIDDTTLLYLGMCTYTGAVCGIEHLTYTTILTYNSDELTTAVYLCYY